MALEDKERWNEKYQDNKIPDEPVKLIRDHVHLATGKQALDLACGMGRHSKYLASLGFEVDALDISSVAIRSSRNCSAIYLRLYRSVSPNRITDSDRIRNFRSRRPNVLWGLKKYPKSPRFWSITPGVRNHDSTGIANWCFTYLSAITVCFSTERAVARGVARIIPSRITAVA